MPEAILWTQAAAASRTQPARRWDEESQSYVQIVDDETGEPLVEKIPQRGHVGKRDYDNPELIKQVGWLHVLRHEGNEVRLKLTNGAAQENLNESYCHFMRAKARHFGWLVVGRCPLAAIAAGEIKRSHLADKTIKGEACASGTYNALRPCKHYIAERDARRDRNRKIDAKRNQSFKPEADKLIEAQQKQTTEIVTGMSTALADALKGVLVAAPAETESKKK